MAFNNISCMYITPHGEWDFIFYFASTVLYGIMFWHHRFNRFSVLAIAKSESEKKVVHDDFEITQNWWFSLDFAWFPGILSLSCSPMWHYVLPLGNSIFVLQDAAWKMTPGLRRISCGRSQCIHTSRGRCRVFRFFAWFFHGFETFFGSDSMDFDSENIDFSWFTSW